MESVESKENYEVCFAWFGGIFLFFCVAKLRSETIVWTNTAGGNWNVATNWQPDQVPGEGDDVVINLDGNYTVTNTTGTPNLSTLTIGPANGQQTLLVAAPFGVLTFTNQAIVYPNGVLTLKAHVTQVESGPLFIYGTCNLIDGFIHSPIYVAPNGQMNFMGATNMPIGNVITNAGEILWTGAGEIYSGSINALLYLTFWR